MRPSRCPHRSAQSYFWLLFFYFLNWKLARRLLQLWGTFTPILIFFYALVCSIYGGRKKQSVGTGQANKKTIMQPIRTAAWMVITLRMLSTFFTAYIYISIVCLVSRFLLLFSYFLLLRLPQHLRGGLAYGLSPEFFFIFFIFFFICAKKKCFNTFWHYF